MNKLHNHLLIQFVLVYEGFSSQKYRKHFCRHFQLKHKFWERSLHVVYQLLSLNFATNSPLWFTENSPHKNRIKISADVSNWSTNSWSKNLLVIYILLSLKIGIQDKNTTDQNKWPSPLPLSIFRWKHLTSSFFIGRKKSHDQSLRHYVNKSP